MLRFRLATLLVVILVAAIGCAALVQSNDLWRRSIVSLTVAILLIAVIYAFLADATRRVFAVGFAVAGWLYFTLTFASFFTLRNDLLTGWVTDKSYALLHEEEEEVLGIAFTGQGYLATQTKAGTVRYWDANTGQLVSDPKSSENFADISHSLWSLLLALAVGTLAAWIHRKRRHAENEGEPA